MKKAPAKRYASNDYSYDAQIARGTLKPYPGDAKYAQGLDRLNGRKRQKKTTRKSSRASGRK